MGDHFREEPGLARDQRLVTIDVLPDDVLVEIFDAYLYRRDWPYPDPPNLWHELVHVCRKWRYLVFASPRRLNLRLGYEGCGPMSEVPGAWPVLPIILYSSPSGHPKSDQRWDNRVAALESEHYNRICEIHIIDMTNSRWEGFIAAMRKPFPELTHLQVSVHNRDMVPVLSDSFLGGSAPSLRVLELEGIIFPSIPKLLLSVNGLVKLYLKDIPDSGYISPDVMATALTVMIRLESLYIGFRSPPPLPDPTSQSLSPSTRLVLPALTGLTFKGAYEYLEDLLAWIDTPLLYNLCIVFFVESNFDVPQLHRLIGHAEGFKACDNADVVIFDYSIHLSLYPKTRAVDHRPLLKLQFDCEDLDWQLSSLARVCNSSFPLISALEELEIREFEYLSSFHWEGEIENARWLELLGPFTALKDLYLTRKIARRVCGALQELSGERATEVLPALRNIFLKGFGPFEDIEEAIRPFVAARRLSGHPVAIKR